MKLDDQKCCSSTVRIKLNPVFEMGSAEPCNLSRGHGGKRTGKSVGLHPSVSSSSFSLSYCLNSVSEKCVRCFQKTKLQS